MKKKLFIYKVNKIKINIKLPKRFRLNKEKLFDAIEVPATIDKDFKLHYPLIWHTRKFPNGKIENKKKYLKFKPITIKNKIFESTQRKVEETTLP